MFDIKINIMDNVDMDIISNIEYKLLNGFDLTQNELDYFLNYVAYQTRVLLSFKKNKNIEDYNFNFMCDTAQSIIARYFDELGLVYNAVQTQDAISKDILGHSFIVCSFMVDGLNKSYIIDPAFNQFFDIDRCKESEFKVINNNVLKTPDLGYFALKSSENSQNSIKKLLKRGYIKLNEETAKIYGDLFYKTKLGSVNYFNSNLEMPGNIYIKSFLKANSKLTYTLDELREMGLSLETCYKDKKNSINF